MPCPQQSSGAVMWIAGRARPRAAHCTCRMAALQWALQLAASRSDFSLVLPLWTHSYWPCLDSVHKLTASCQSLSIPAPAHPTEGAVVSRIYQLLPDEH